MSAELTPVLKQRFFDANGDPLAGGKLYSYVAGTSTPLATYTDQSGLVANSNPVILDADGYAEVWMAQVGYKFMLTDVLDVEIFTVDNVLSITQQVTGDTKFPIVDGQAATACDGEAWDGFVNTSVVYFFEGIRNNSTIADGRFVLQFDGTNWRVVLDGYNGDDVGLTFTVTTVGTTGQLYVAADSGAGDGSVKFKKFPFAA